MDHKKVDPVRLSYSLDDGTVIERDYMAEFNDGVFSGNISAATGTFAGTLTANAIDAVGNVNIQGSAVARTFINRRAYVSHWDDDSIWRPVSHMDAHIPYDDQGGGFLSVVIQFRTSDRRDDKGFFRCRLRFVVGGQVIYTSEKMMMGVLVGNYNTDAYLYEFLHPVPGPGTYRVATELVVYPADTNMFIEFADIITRVDYVRK